MYRAAVAVSTVLLASMCATTATARPATPTCLGKPATIVGTAASETIRGTAGDDVIVGRGDDDVIYGYGGDDRICTDPDSSRAVVFAGAGNDSVRSSGYLFGQSGDDHLVNAVRSGSMEVLVGGPGDDVLRSSSWEDNHFLPGRGNDTMIGANRANYNIANYSSARHGVLVDLGAGTALGQGHDILIRINTVRGSPHADTLFGESAMPYNLLYGMDGSDILIGRGGPDLVSGGNGDDLVAGGPGNDDLAGGPGLDALWGRAGNDNLHERQPEPNLILAGPGKDNCWGHYLIPPNIEQGCETHHRVSGGDKTLPNQ